VVPHRRAVPLVLELAERMRPVGRLESGSRAAAGTPAREIRFEHVRFAYPGTDRAVLDGLDLTIPAGRSLAIVGQNGAGKTTLAKLVCRLYDPDGGAIRVDGVDLRELDLASWRARIAAVFQDYVRYELSLRDNADQIVVLDGSRVVEAGSHAELVARRGLYAELFEAQASAYR
jgi:ABC-type multidrug transport system fused ATPase/permease subunit